MSEKESSKDKKVKDLLSQLASKDEAAQLKSIKSLKIHGNESAIEPLVQVLSISSSEKVKNEITELLNTIKSTAVPAEIAKCLGNPSYKNVRQQLLISIWSSGLDYRPYMGEIATATVQGGLMEAIECITILENLEGGLDEEQIMDGLLVFKSYLVDERDGDDSKTEIIKEIVSLLQNMNDSI
jgi:HEAT repeat protein